MVRAGSLARMSHQMSPGVTGDPFTAALEPSRLRCVDHSYSFELWVPRTSLIRAVPPHGVPPLIGVVSGAKGAIDVRETSWKARMVDHKLLYACFRSQHATAGRAGLSSLQRDWAAQVVTFVGCVRWADVSRMSSRLASR